MEHRNLDAFAQLLLDDEALRRLDVLKVDAAEGRLERGDDVDQLVRIALVDFDVEHVDAGELLEQHALAFHAGSKPGKLEVNPTKPMATQRDLSLAYSPGVAVPVLRIAENPDLGWAYTTRGNLVAVISNGTAILGLGDLGALASKPVMEGKAVLFKRFADVNSIDLEVDTKDVEQFINAVRYLGPSFGGINLE
ncbi:MAG: hypothetical protein IT478_00490, partial [Xanthomonadales bacterium]|nr:hypothetical protein [Xanthomonadales bacterium]